MKQKQTIAITTGTLTLPVLRDGKPVGALHLQTDDTAFLSRFYALIPHMEALRESLAEALAKAAEEPAAALAAMDDACNAMRTEIDAVFGQGTSETVFGAACSLPMIRQFFEGVSEALGTARAPKLAQYTAPQGEVLE